MDYVNQNKAAWQRAIAYGINAGAWMVYTAIFHGGAGIDNKTLMDVCHCSKAALISYRQALVAAGLIAYTSGGGRGKAGTYTIVDLVGRGLTGNISAVNAPKTATIKAVDVVVAVPEQTPVAAQQNVQYSPDGFPLPPSLFPDYEPTPTTAQVPAARPEKPKPEMPKQRYGPYGRILLSDRDVKLLNSKYPGWQNYVEPADEWLYRRKQTKKDYYTFLVNWIKRDLQRNPVSAVPDKAVQAAQALDETDDMFAAARAARLKEWGD